MFLSKMLNYILETKNVRATKEVRGIHIEHSNWTFSMTSFYRILAQNPTNNQFFSICLQINNVIKWNVFIYLKERYKQKMYVCGFITFRRNTFMFYTWSLQNNFLKRKKVIQKDESLKRKEVANFPWQYTMVSKL